MKKQLKSLVLIALLVCYAPQLMAQASTEGKEFWVALTLSAAPSSGLPDPFIAVSTKEATTITITNPNDPDWAGVTKSVGANEWSVFTTSDIPLDKWYPTSANSIDNIVPQAGKTNNYGLKVNTDKEASVFAALWMENSFDAANILPIHVLQYNYYTQDYPPYIKPDDGKALAMFTILATENNTKVQITPTSPTSDNHAAGESYTVTLNAGQTYYVISQTMQSLSGTHVESLNNKKIAIFQGDVFTQIPGGKAARDCTYEQAIPTDFWGTQFAITRSKEKDANRVRVTAMVDDTEIYIQSILKATLKAGETYEFEMSKNDWSNSIISSTIHHVPASDIITDDATYLNSSCPVAVYSYDVSNGYAANTSEMDNNKGDPSMVWISPLEQRIKKITFGVCGTSKTDKHFMDIVCMTSDADKTTITPAPVETPAWQPVPGNSEWSYARIHLSTVGKNGSGNRVFTLQNPEGCIAHVYGNGNDESYSYSVGSAAVKRGILVNDTTFNDTIVDISKAATFCVNEEWTFNPDPMGAGNITKVIWDFGDGVTTEIERSDENDNLLYTHPYPVPGWYDVKVIVFGEEFCSQPAFTDTIAFTFRVIKPDTIMVDTIICAEDLPNYRFSKDPNQTVYSMKDESVDETIRDTIQADNCGGVYCLSIYAIAKADTIVDWAESYPIELRRDSALIPADDIGNPAEWVYTSGDYIRTYYRSNSKCDSVVTHRVAIVKCLDLVLEDTDSLITCHGAKFDIACHHSVDAEIGEGIFTCGNLEQPVYFEKDSTDGEREFGSIIIPAEQLQPGYYQAVLAFEDPNCEQKLSFPINFAVHYADSIFKFKFNNVLAVYQNKGFSFTHYQWYRNGEPIVGATDANYHSELPFEAGDEYFVMLTDQSGITLPSCPQEIPEEVPSFEPEPNAAPAKKAVFNQQMLIIRDGKMYNVFGQRIK